MTARSVAGAGFRKNSQIWQPEDRGDRIYFVEQGEIAIFRGILSGVICCCKRHMLESRSAKCVYALKGPGSETAARASTDVVVLEIKYEAFLRYLETHTPALNGLVCTLCLRLSDCESQSEILAHRGAQERLGRLLVQLGKKGPNARKGLPVLLHVSHREIALMAAMSRPHVSVILGYFRRMKLVQYERGRPLSVNVGALVAYIASREATSARGGRKA